MLRLSIQQCRWLIKGLACIGALACSERQVEHVGARSAAPAPSVAETRVDAPPLARMVPYADTAHGVELPDPYRWLEDTLSVESREWVMRQETYASSVLARVVSRDSLAALYDRAFLNAPTLDRVHETPTGLVITRWLGEEPSMFIVPKGVNDERLVFDAKKRATRAENSSLRAFVPSHDGRLIAMGTTSSGDAGAAISVVDATSGAMLTDRIPDLLTTTSGTRYQVNWLPQRNSYAFVYPRLWPTSASGPAADRLARGRQFLHRIGTPQSTDLAIFGYGVTPSVVIAPEDLATRVYATEGSQWLVGSVFRSRLNGTDFYAGRRTSGDSTVPSWAPLLSVSDIAGGPQLRGDTVWVLARRAADRGQIIRRVLGSGSLPAGDWQVVVPERRGVITTLALQNDAVYFLERDAGAIQLYVLPHGESRVRAVTLPATGTLQFMPRTSSMDGVLVSVQSWATAPRWFRVTRAGAAVEQLNIDDGEKTPASSTIVSTRFEARSHDGALVPVSLVYDSSALLAGKLDGTAPVIIEAYGGFGQSTDPMYDPNVQVWTALGGIYAYAHVRGGGELGDAWHRAATRERKQHSIDDMIGATEALIARGYTSAGRVAIRGISFGAIVSGLAPLQRADLFSVAVYDVGGPDEIRAAALDPSSARNLAEIGDVDSPEGIRMLRDVSPYHVIPAKIALPAMLLHSARDDYNFGTEMLVGKFVARLQAANSGKKPIIWVRTAGGHRWLSSISPQWAATVSSFLLWQSGDPRFQPASTPNPGH